MADGNSGSGAGANQSNGTQMDVKTRERMEGLLEDSIKNALFGYKNRTDVTERKVAFESEAIAEKLFAHLYADDPVNAKRRWQEYSGKAADRGLISRAEHLVIDKVTPESIDALEIEQKGTAERTNTYLNDSSNKNRKKEMNTLRVAMGDSERAQRNFRRSATDQIFEQQKEVDGLTIGKAAIKGATRVPDDYLAAWRESRKGKIMQEEVNEILGKGKNPSVSSRVFQSVRGSVKPEGAASAFMKGVVFAAAKMAHTMASKMTGESRQQAQKENPAPIRLLPAPGRHFGAGPDMDNGLAI